MIQLSQEQKDRLQTVMEKWTDEQKAKAQKLMQHFSTEEKKPWVSLLNKIKSLKSNTK